MGLLSFGAHDPPPGNTRVERGSKEARMTPKSKPLFDPKLFLAKVGEGRTIAEYSKDQMVFSQGDPANAVFYIQKGKIKVTVVSNNGKEAVIAILDSGDFLGEGCLAAQTLRMATATAISDCALVRLEKAAMIRVLHEEPAFSEMFLSYVCRWRRKTGPFSRDGNRPVCGLPFGLQ